MEPVQLSICIGKAASGSRSGSRTEGSGMATQSIETSAVTAKASPKKTDARIEKTRIRIAPKPWKSRSIACDSGIGTGA